MWWFYISWLPDFLKKQYGLEVMSTIVPMLIIYGISDLGSIFGGWFSSALIRRGATVNRARKSALLLAAFLVLPIIFAGHVSHPWVAIGILGVATAGHQAFSSNLYTLVSDMFPRRTVGSVAGFGGMCGYSAAALFQFIVGIVVDTQKNYAIPFLCAGTAYFLAFAIIHLLAPRLEPVKISDLLPVASQRVP